MHEIGDEREAFRWRETLADATPRASIRDSDATRKLVSKTPRKRAVGGPTKANPRKQDLRSKTKKRTGAREHRKRTRKHSRIVNAREKFEYKCFFARSAFYAER